MYLVSFTTAVFCLALAVLILRRDARSTVHRIFAGGMALLALEEFVVGLSAQAMSAQEVMRWQSLRVLVLAFVPGTWLLFSLSFGRTNYAEFLRKWRWVCTAAFAAPVLLALVWGGSFFAAAPFAADFGVRWFVPLGRSGYAFFLCHLVVFVLILMNLERTLRGFSGSIRWQVKFMVLGVGALFAAAVYTSSQTILYSSLNTGLDFVASAARVVANVLILISLLRLPALHIDLYFSDKVVYNSVTLLGVGIYLIAVAILAKAVPYFGGDLSLVLGPLILFVALLGLIIILLSDEWRHNLKRLISRHFGRPHYDYRNEWARFTERTASITDIKRLCSSVVGMVAEVFSVSSVSIWLLDDVGGQVSLGGSTVYSESGPEGSRGAAQFPRELVRRLKEIDEPVDLVDGSFIWSENGGKQHVDFLTEAGVRYCARLKSREEMLGFMTVSGRLAKGPFTAEDRDLFKTIADQVAASILNLKLSDELLRAKEMEAFQTVAAFFVHDIKNLAYTLSLTMQNLPANFEDPLFRKDALNTMAQCVNKMNAIWGRLSSLGKKPELDLKATDLNDLVGTAVAGLNGTLKASVIEAMGTVPKVQVDPELMHKVLLNLLLNAHEAVNGQGEIHVSTEKRDGSVVLSVSDNGCGISKEFITQSLFRPFKTNKMRGLGIGLFQCKRIVEAHEGKIEVDTEEGKGSTFRIVLPAVGEKSA